MILGPEQAKTRFYEQIWGLDLTSLGSPKFHSTQWNTQFMGRITIYVDNCFRTVICGVTGCQFLLGKLSSYGSPSPGLASGLLLLVLCE